MRIYPAFGRGNSHFAGVVHQINHLYNILILECLVAVVLKDGTHLKHTHIRLLLLLSQIVEEEWDYIHGGTDGSNQHQHAQQREQHAVYIIQCGRWVHKVILSVGQLLLQHLTDGLGGAGQHSGHQGAVSGHALGNRSGHTVLLL